MNNYSFLASGDQDKYLNNIVANSVFKYQGHGDNGADDSVLGDGYLRSWALKSSQKRRLH